MRTKWFVWLLLAVAGCGGSGGSSINQFRGNWAGSWFDNTTSGTMVISVNSSGAISGTVQSISFGAGAASGQVNDSGNFQAFIQYSGQPTVQVQGTMTINGNNVTGTGTNGLSFDLDRQ